MEDIPRDVQKELESYKAPKKTRKAGHWTLLFIGDQGEVITIRKFKGLMLLAIFIMLVALSAAVSIYLVYKKPFEENRRLQAELAGSARQVRVLGEERDLLLTRLGIAESRLKTLLPSPVPKEEPDDQAGSQAPAPDAPEPFPPPVAADLPEAGEAREKTDVSGKPDVPVPPPAVIDVKPEVKVDVREFQVRHDPVEKLLNVQFRLKNVNVETGAVSGRTFVVLEDDRDPGAGVLTFPRVKIVDGKPARIHLGRYFSISRFNIVKFKRVYEQAPRPFNSATVFVYSGAGDLLLEKRFTIDSPFKEASAAEPETGPAPAEEAGEHGDDREGGLPDNTILNN